MRKKFSAMSRLETAIAYVNNGKIVRVYQSHDEPGGECYTVKRSDEDFEFRLRNVLDIIQLHNKEGFEELLNIIRESDHRSYAVAVDVIEINKKVDEFLKQPGAMEELEKIFGRHDYDYFD